MTVIGYLVSVGLLLLPASLWGAEQAVPEYAMKTAYLYNFAQLAEWPSGGDSGKNPDFRICTYGTEAWGNALEILASKKVSGRTVRLLPIQEAAEARQCDLLFIGEGDPRRSAGLIGGVRGLPVMTVTDTPRIDAMLTIVNDERRLAFEVNLGYARESQLRLSSKLLNLARRVVGQR